MRIRGLPAWPLATAVALAVQSLVAAPITVSTTAGIVRGTQEANHINAYLGIPYAKPPIGPLRWRVPESPESWQGVRAASQFPASCFQPWPPPKFGPYTSEYVDTPAPSEDCLYLNVWAPGSSEARLPVLVWIHGGGFLGGSGAIEIYNGRHLASQGVVVVTINYRVGPFGFLALPELTAESPHGGSGNFGLLDMIAALKWVRDNIAAFGGDPRNVTIAGQSAGAVAVNSLLTSPDASGLFSRGIAESGSGMGVPAEPIHDAEMEGEKFSKWLGARNLAELRTLPAEKIQSGVFMPVGQVAGEGPPPIRFKPVVDGAILRANPDDPAATVESPVPLITGFNQDEGYDPSRRVSAVQFELSVRENYKEHAMRFLALYPHASDEEAAKSQRLLARDRYMSSLLLWSKKHADAGQQRVYAYLYEHPVPIVQGPSWGTFHTAEVPYVFGVLNRNERPYTAIDERVAAEMSAYWLAFMRTGDPNGPNLHRWTPIDREGLDVMGLGDQVGPRAAVSSVERFAAFREFVRDGGHLSLF